MTSLRILFAAALLIAASSVTQAVAATPQGDFYKKDSSGSLGSQDTKLKEAASAQPIVTADGSVLETTASHLLLVDYASGTVLAEKAANERMYPSSMTKIMTLYVAFQKMKEGSLKPETTFTVSERAWRMQGSKSFVPLGEQVSVHDLIMGISVQSGNDACVALAEGIAGSEEAFVNLMNEAAKKIGMQSSHFVDSSGWPHDDHYTTPHDLALLAAALVRDFPEYYHYFSEPEFSYHGIRQYNRNLLLKHPTLGVDGLKTGHTEAAGYGITLSAKEPETARRLILVINGLESEAKRAEEGEHLLSWGMRNFTVKELFTPGQVIAKAQTWMGEEDEVGLTVAEPVNVVLPNVGRDKLRMAATYNKPVPTPIEQGQELGKLVITQPSGKEIEVPLVAASSVEKRSWFGRIPAMISYWLE